MSAQRDRCVAQESGSATLLALRGQVKLCEATATGSSARAPRRPAWREHALRRGCYTSPPCIAAQVLRPRKRHVGPEREMPAPGHHALLSLRDASAALREDGPRPRCAALARHAPARPDGPPPEPAGAVRPAWLPPARAGRQAPGRRWSSPVRPGGSGSAPLPPPPAWQPQSWQPQAWRPQACQPQAWPLRSPGAERRRPKCPVRATR